MRLLGLLQAVCLTIAPIAVAADVADCIKVEPDLDRLACYDRESGRTPSVETVPQNSAWRVSIEKSDMTDDTNVFLSVQANEPVFCSFARSGTTPTLLLRCMENTTSVLIAADCHLVSSDYNNYGDVTYRLDDNKAATKGFAESTNNRALGLWRGGSAIPFIKAMLGHSKLLTRFTPYSDSAVTAEFNITGLEEAIAPLRKACGW